MGYGRGALLLVKKVSLRNSARRTKFPSITDSTDPETRGQRLKKGTFVDKGYRIPVSSNLPVSRAAWGAFGSSIDAAVLVFGPNKVSLFVAF